MISGVKMITIETISKTIHLHSDTGQFQAQLTADAARGLAAGLIEAAEAAEAWEVRRKAEELDAKRLRLEVLEADVAALRAELGVSCK